MAKAVEKARNNQVPQRGKLIFNLELADILRFTMFGTLIAIANDIARVPLQLPGHTSIWWIGILVLGRGLIPKFGGGTIMGLVSGILAVFLGLGNKGVFFFFVYLIPGIMLDIVAPIFRNKFESPVISTLLGIIAALSKMLINTVLGFLLNIPAVFLAIGLGFTAISHVLFGAIGGFLASLLIKRLKPRLTNWD